MKSDYEPTSLELKLHLALQAMGIFSIANSIPPMLYLLSMDARSKINRFRWLLLAIVISGLLMDLQLTIGISPYPLLPHIAFWADGLLVRIHRRAIVYLMALFLFFIYLWVTTMLLAFLFRLAAVLDRIYSNRVKQFAYFIVAFCAFNTSMSCGILVLKYPSQVRVDAYITEKVPAMKFVLDTPGYIYFTRMEQFHYAQIGMAHLICCVPFYMASFLGVFIVINVNLWRSRYLMSSNTRKMHYMLFKSLMSQMVLPLISMIIPVVLTALSIRFGREDDGIDHQLIGHCSTLLASLHSILNTMSMFWFVKPFRRFLSSRVSPLPTVDSQTNSRNTQHSAASTTMPIVVSDI